MTVARKLNFCATRLSSVRFAAYRPAHPTCYIPPSLRDERVRLYFASPHHYFRAGVCDPGLPRSGKL